MNRRLPEAEEPPFLPPQRLSLLDAIRAYTAGSAWINGFDDTGVIEVGALVDLAVLDRDPFSGSAEEIASAGIAQTHVDGVRVYSSSEG